MTLLDRSLVRKSDTRDHDIHKHHIEFSSYFSGFKNHDVAFFHTPSKSLVQADLLMNLPPKEQVSLMLFAPWCLPANFGRPIHLCLAPCQQYSKSKSSSQLPILSGLLNPWGTTQKRALWSLGLDKAYVSVRQKSRRDAQAKINSLFCLDTLHAHISRAMKRDAKTVAGWDFTRIIPCHGVCLPKESSSSYYFDDANTFSGHYRR